MQYCTFVDVLTDRAAEPDRAAYTYLLDGEEAECRLTFRELDRQARTVAAHLLEHRLTGQPVLLLYAPGLEYIAGLFGCFYSGAIAVPCWPPDLVRLQRTLPRLLAVARDCHAAAVLTTSAIAGLADTLRALAPELAALRWLASDGMAQDAASSFRLPTLSARSLALLQYTSGSTSEPKGVMLSHENLLHNSAAIRDLFDHRDERRSGVIWLPPYHDMGLIGGLLQMAYVGGHVTLMSPIDFLKRPVRWLKALTRTRAHTSGGPNFAYDLCVRKVTPAQKQELDLSSWGVAFNGAEPIRSDTLERFAAAFAECGFRKDSFYPCYGLAEATLIAAGPRPDRRAGISLLTVDSESLSRGRVVPPSREGARTQQLVGCGPGLSDQQLLIVDAESRRPCPEGHVGEIWIAGRSVSQGYFQRPEATAATFGTCLADSGEGPFLRTGDLGFLQDGELFVTGRCKDVLIFDGRNHYPQDIELTVERSHPTLRPGGSAALSVDGGAAARLVILAEVDGKEHPSGEAVAAAIRRAVAENHDLRVAAVRLLRAATLPKTGSGKVQRFACRTGFLNDTLDVCFRAD